MLFENDVDDDSGYSLEMGWLCSEILLTKLISAHIQGGGNSLDYEDDLLGGSLGDLESEHGQRMEDGVLSPEDSDLAQLR